MSVLARMDIPWTRMSRPAACEKACHGCSALSCKCRGAHQCHGPGCSPISCMGEVPAPGALDIHHVGIGDVHSVGACRPVNAACVLQSLHPNTRMPLNLHGTLQCYGRIRTGFGESLFLLTASTGSFSCSFQSTPFIGENSRVSTTKMCPVCRE